MLAKIFPVIQGCDGGPGAEQKLPASPLGGLDQADQMRGNPSRASIAALRMRKF